MADERYVQRFTVSERVVHVLLFGSLLILSVTGLTLKLHDSPLVQWFIRFEGGILLRGWIHRFAALVLMGTFFYHILSIMFSQRVNEFFRDMMFRRKDLKDLLLLLKYDLGLQKEPPAFARFSCIEKIQYWAAGLATVLLGVSGIMLWAETVFMVVLPKWVIDLNRIVHSFEATIGFLVLVVWHLYNVHLNPRVFPMSRVWLTGRISKEDLRRDHPLEYERVFGNEDS